MKYIIVLASGLADEPVADLDDQTPLAVARTPVLDEISRKGKIGRVVTLPEDLPASEEVALLSALGYDPHIHFSGEAGLAAADLVKGAFEGQVAFMHNFVTEADGLIVDHAAGHISAREAEALLDDLFDALDERHVQFSVGQGFTGITVMDMEVLPPPECFPPEAMWNRPIEEGLPEGEDAEPLRRLMRLSREIFAEHEINRVRADLGENQAGLLWLWGPGRPPALPSFESMHKLQATMIAASESARGLGRLTGMDVPKIAGAGGGYETDYAAKARYAIDALALCDVVVVHAAAPAEASLEGDIQKKVGVIHDIDSKLLGPLFRHANENEFVRLLFLPTHVANVSTRTRLRAAVPAVMFGPGLEPLRGGAYTEPAAAQAEIVVERGHELLAYFLRT